MGIFLGACAAQICCSCLSSSATCFGEDDKSTKMIYSTLLFVMSIISFLLMNVSLYINQSLQSVLQSVWGFVGCDENKCFGVMAVLRVLAALTVFHLFFSLLMIGVTEKIDKRAEFHNHWWPLKVLVLVSLTLAFFLIPNEVFIYYGYIALGGSIFFILFQLVMLVNFSHSWSELWVGKFEKENQSRFWPFVLISSTFLLYLISLTGTILMYIYYSKPEGNCGFVTAFITLNLIATLIYSVLSVSSKVREKNPRSGLLQSSVVCCFCTFLVFSSISSFTKCTNIPVDPKSPTSILNTIVGVVFCFISVIYSALSTSSSLDGGEEEQEKIKELPQEGEVAKKETDALARSTIVPQKVTYSYSFFHVSFCWASMYLGMVLTNWSVSTVSSSIDVYNGETSSWVKIASSWFTILLYVWTVIAPVMFPNRDFTVQRTKKKEFLKV